ncbi:hypothetical protein BKA70DRAFT_1265589 [Coprinopsis sp. MPI-PUGE-AT-0042]|nr:hypothetical protein BKA70DRAFT_1265589 [Coprinopsis sp. MPI-PUGE-AT-0042]
MASSSSTALADALAVLSRTAHQIIADAETRSRTEAAGSLAEANEARYQRDKALKDLVHAQAEAQAWKEEVNRSKATLGQAELTIAHQADSINQQNEVIAQMKREMAQWKDQSKNWQEHFLRVEQERCVLASRVDELLSERLQDTKSVLGSSNSGLRPFTTPQPRLLDTQPGPSHLNQRPYPSPARTTSAKTQNADEETLVKPKAESVKPRKSTGAAKASKTPAKPKPSTSKDTKPPKVQTKRESEKPLVAQAQRLAQKSTPQQKPTPTKTTVIRRVRAVIDVKREEDTDDELPAEEGYATAGQKRRGKKVALGVEEDEDYEEEFQPNRHTRPRKAIHYPEDSDEGEYVESSEEDELNMASQNRSRSTNPLRDAFGTPAGSPAKKKRKTTTSIA